MSLAEIISICANLALTLSLIVAIIFGISQERTAEHDRKERLTLETLRTFATREFARNIYFITRGNMPCSAKDFYALPPEEQALLIQFGQEMESLGLLVAEGFISIDLVDKTLGSFVTTTWKKYTPVFNELRQETNDPFLGEYFQWLAKVIEERMKKSPRRPFHETLPLSPFTDVS
jgi:hypothetical protein